MRRECQTAILSMRGILGRMRRATAAGLDMSMVQALCDRKMRRCVRRERQGGSCYSWVRECQIDKRSGERQSGSCLCHFVILSFCSCGQPGKSPKF